MADLYDVVGAFQRIEEELIDSMQRNMKRHIGEEMVEGINWTQWQGEMLKGFQEYRAENAEKIPGYYSTINDQIDNAIRQAYATGESEQEVELLKALKKGYVPDETGVGTDAFRGSFFRINESKLNSLINATTGDFKEAEKAILRRADDAYRSTIFNAQTYMQSGAGSLWSAVDMASKDFLKSGINCVQYKNGARVNIVSYSEMALRTSSSRASMLGSANKRMEHGIHTVFVSSHNGACPFCVQWQGRVYYDDVYGGLSDIERQEGKYPLLSEAVSGGLFHPNCSHGTATYYDGVTKEPVPMTAEEKAASIEQYNLEQRQRQCERNIRSYTRLQNGSIDPANKDYYNAKKQQWTMEYKSLLKRHSDVLRANPARLRLYGIDKINTGTINTPMTKYKGSVVKVAPQATNSEWSSYKFNNVTYNNKKEIENHLMTEYGIAFKDSRKYAIDKDLFEDCSNWLDKFTGCYSNFASKNKINLPELNVKAPSGMKNNVGYYSFYPHNNKAVELALNGQYHSNTDLFQRYVDHCVETKWYPANATIHKTFVHEYGHHVSNSLCAVYGNDWEHKFITECVEEFKKVTPEYTYNTYAGLTDYLSMYGSTKECECFAESFAEYFGGENPRSFATIFGKKLEKILMGV